MYMALASVEDIVTLRDMLISNPKSYNVFGISLHGVVFDMSMMMVFKSLLSIFPCALMRSVTFEDCRFSDGNFFHMPLSGAVFSEGTCIPTGIFS